MVFDGESSTDADAVEEWAIDGGPFAGGHPQVATDGRLVTATGPVPTGDIAEFDGGFAKSGGLPTAAFGFESDGEAGTVTITHDGGDGIGAPDLHVRGDGFADRAGAGQTAAGQWRGRVTDGQVFAGDSVVVGVTPANDLRVVFDNGTRSATMATASGPEA